MNAFKEWLKTDTGKNCAEFHTLKEAKYLENRLYHAFIAGVINEYERNKPAQLTIEWYEQRKRASDKLIKELRAKIEHLEKAQVQQQQEPTPSPDV